MKNTVVLKAIDELYVVIRSLESVVHLLGGYGFNQKDCIIEGTGLLLTVLRDRLKEVKQGLEGLHKSEHPFGKRRLFGAIEVYCQGKCIDTEGALADMIEKATDLGFTDWKKTADFNGFVMVTTDNQDEEET